MPPSKAPGNEFSNSVWGCSGECCGYDDNRSKSEESDFILEEDANDHTFEPERTQVTAQKRMKSAYQMQEEVYAHLLQVMEHSEDSNKKVKWIQSSITLESAGGLSL